MNEKWQALASEAAQAAEHLAIGVTALGKANYAHPAYYHQAFFALSTGLERTARIALIVDYALDNHEEFPEPAILQRYGHNLKRLLYRTDEIALRRGLMRVQERIPHSPIHAGILAVLGNFSSNLIRDNNLDFLFNVPHIHAGVNPVQEWNEKVTVPVLNLFYRKHRTEQSEQKARFIAQLHNGQTYVLHFSESDEIVDSIYKASRQTALTDHVKPYVRLYVMQIIRFLANVLSELGYLAQVRQPDYIPFLAEPFDLFRTDNDMYFKKRKSWTIRKRKP